MSSKEIISAASDPEFYMRVCFIALRVAQIVAAEEPTVANRDNRISYANRVLQGADNAILLAAHVACNPVISAALEEGGPDAVADMDIESTLVSIWDARSNAFAAPMTPAHVLPMPQPDPPPAVVGAGYPQNV